MGSRAVNRLRTAAMFVEVKVLLLCLHNVKNADFLLVQNLSISVSNLYSVGCAKQPPSHAGYDAGSARTIDVDNLMQDQQSHVHE